jgi:ribonuclease P protein component
MRFRPEQHLRRPGDFRRVREEGRRLACGLFTLWWLPHDRPSPAPLRRLGVVASKVAVGAAVARNRAKRRLRSVFRLHQSLLPPAGDLVIVARAALNRVSFAALETEFSNACRKLAPATHA